MRPEYLEIGQWRKGENMKNAFNLLMSLITIPAIALSQPSKERTVNKLIIHADNVLQEMILTQNEKMILTPTYHVFDMYQAHQDALLLPHDLKSEEYVLG